MRTRDRLWVGFLAVLAVLIWLRDRSWFDSAEEALPALAALPLFCWMGTPWNWFGTGRTSTDSDPSPRILGAAFLALLLGVSLNITLLLALGWTAALWAWLKSAVPAEDHQRLFRLLVLPFVAFPWITLDLQPLGWWFRLSGAWASELVLSFTGLDVSRQGTQMLVQGMPVSVDISCSGLKVLQSLLVAGTLLAYSLLGRTRRYWWNVALLLPVAWIANTARVLTISLAAMTFGPEFAMGVFHSWGGLMVLMLMFLGSYFLFRWQNSQERSLVI